MEKLYAQRTNLIAWKSGLTNEIKSLERNLNQLYDLVGIKVSSVVDFEGENGTSTQNANQHADSNYSAIIEDYLSKTTKSVRNICALVSAKTEFELPIPAYVLLKLASKIGLLRCKDHQKMPDQLARRYVYSKSPDLIDLSLLLFRVVVSCLGSNVIPFTPFINSTLISTLEWTRTSNLREYNEKHFHVVRSRLLLTLSFMLELLSLNVNLEPSDFKNLIGTELMGILDDLKDAKSPQNAGLVLYKDEHMISACKCLSQLILVYGSQFEVKNYIVKTCLGIYRDFESNLIRPKCRLQLLELLQIVANQPHATSTTEMAYHIFELAGRLDDDVEVRCLARRILNLGLAHRPTIVSPFEVHSCHGHPMELSAATAESRTEQIREPQQQEHPRLDKDPQDRVVLQMEDSPLELEQPRQLQQLPQQQDREPQHLEEQQGSNQQQQDEAQKQQQQQQPEEHVQPSQQNQSEQQQQQQQQGQQPQAMARQLQQRREEEQQQQQQQQTSSAPASDSEVQYYMNFFVEKLASPRSIT